MRVFLPLPAVTAAALLLVTVTGATPAAADWNPHGTPLVKVSQGDPYAKCTIGARSPDSVVYPGTEVEPYLSVDPRDPKRVVTVFQQDRWNDGGARGLAAGWTTDGHTFHRSTLPFSLCAPGGADYERATDPWVSTGPDGTVYAGGEGVDFTGFLRGCPGLQAGEESDSCGAGQGQPDRRRGDPASTPHGGDAAHDDRELSTVGPLG
ncbi:hypothetical protein ACIBJF_49730 [Streptomyces sp. NPDC050743]|uniref:hypothetical protein n=1 Tax=Streptomyces sp. NPDC050743 TaxID=3365634 RepID=UPI0037B3B36A